MIPYVSEADDWEAWVSAAHRRWEELELPEPDPPPQGAEPCYVRLGDRPAGDRLFNHQLREYEPGVAVFRATGWARTTTSWKRC